MNNYPIAKFTRVKINHIFSFYFYFPGLLAVPTLADYYSRQVGPRFAYGQAYMSALLPKVASGLAWAGGESVRAAKTFGRMATPIVRNTARTWRYEQSFCKTCQPPTKLQYLQFRLSSSLFRTSSVYVKTY